jgi:large subunit ribosomal protein L28
LFNQNILIYFALRFWNKYLKIIEMSKICEITGKKVISGNNVSHSNARTKRRFYPNLQTKKFYIPEEDKYITLKVSAAGIRKIDKNGISACIKEAKAKGYMN